MPWKQERNIVISQMGSKKGMCLQNSRIAANPDIPAKYLTARVAASKALLHPGAAPKGLWVPLYFDFWATVDGVYKNWGHVGWQSPDGAFYSDGTKYPNVEEYERTHAPNYIGWGELMNDVRIISYVPDPKPAPSSGRKHLHLNKGTISTFYKEKGGTGSIYARDDTYDYTILKDEGYRVLINSASGGGRGWIYMTYQTGADKGKTIPGRWAK
jgi:hypothetical protein